jgi:hypothetical protein
MASPQDGPSDAARWAKVIIALLWVVGAIALAISANRH